MRKTLTVFVILAIRPAPPVSFRVGTECTDQLYGSSMTLSGRIWRQTVYRYDCLSVHLFGFFS